MTTDMIANKTTQESAEKLLKDLGTLVEDGEELLKAGALELTNQGQEVRARLTAAVERAKLMGEKFKYNAAASARAVDRAAHEHPYEFAGAALAVGLLIGFLAARR